MIDEENIPSILEESCIQLCILSCFGKSENAVNQIHEDWFRVKKEACFHFNWWYGASSDHLSSANGSHYRYVKCTRDENINILDIRFFPSFESKFGYDDFIILNDAFIGNIFLHAKR